MKFHPGWSNIENFGTGNLKALTSIFQNFKINENMAEENSSFQQVGNELIYVRMLNAPRDLVWEVWTEPDHIKEWFGPDGFTITHKTMEVQKGKQWKFTMHGQGQDFENKIEYLEV